MPLPFPIIHHFKVVHTILPTHVRAMPWAFINLSQCTSPPLPALLPRKLLVQQREQLRHAERRILQIQRQLVFLFHLEQVVQLEVEFEQAFCAAWQENGQSRFATLLPTANGVHSSHVPL